MVDVSVVVPVYNASERLEELVRRISHTLESNSFSFEILLVNDASKDASSQKIQYLSENDPSRIFGIDLRSNRGQQVALMFGLQRARADWVVTLDDDFEHPPEEIPRLLSALSQGHDLAYALSDFRTQRRLRGFFRESCSRLSKIAFQRFMGVAVTPNGFRAFRKRIWSENEDAPILRHRQTSLDFLLLKRAVHPVGVRVRLGPTRRRGSAHSPFQLAHFALRTLLDIFCFKWGIRP